eukprot:12070023-Alexandrium_andersonii.AAC.1
MWVRERCQAFCSRQREGSVGHREPDVGLRRGGGRREDQHRVAELPGRWPGEATATGQPIE